MKYTHVYLDAGHGGISPVNKEYTTAPSKQFHFKTDVMHHQGWFYEGVKNREYINRIYQILSDRGNVVPIIVNHDWIDTPLHNRVQLVNYMHNTLQMKGIYFSEHSNAAPGNARGFSVWTSKGETTSDKLADLMIKYYKKSFNTSGIRIREDKADGDSDYEANFYVLRKTDMPAVLSENLFFDNLEDAKLLMDTDYKEKYCEMVAEWLEASIELLNR